MYNRTDLDNGLSLVTYHMPQRVSLSLGIWIKVGARYEQKKISGISHFLEHLLFKGTAKRSCEQIKQSIEGIGGSLNAFTAEELTCYLVKVPWKYWERALVVPWDMVLNARLAPSDIAMERKVILEEIRMYKDLPGHFVLELLTKLLWPRQPLGRNIAGEAESVEAINRKDLLSFKQKFYRLNNIFVVACGNLRHQDLLRECNKYGLPSNGHSGKTQFSKAGTGQTGAQVNFKHKHTEQTHLALGLHALSRNHPQRFSLMLLHIILGANMSSRLFREVREKRGLAYEISSSLKLFQDDGAFIVHAGIDNRRLQEALEVILTQLREIKKNKVNPGELNRAKEYYIGQLQLALEDSSNHMLWLGENIISLKRFRQPDEIIRLIKGINPDDIQKVAHKILQNKNLNLALIGPLQEKDQRQIEERLGL